MSPGNANATVTSREPLLKIDDLRTSFRTEKGLVRAVDGISLTIERGETLCVVGESGSGKSMTALSVLGLLACPPGEISAKRLTFAGRNLLGLDRHQMCQIRGQDIAMIFQEPMTALNPVLTIGYQISEAIRAHQGLSKKKAFERAIEMLRLVGIALPEKRAREYPHQISGGMRQRAMIAMALSCNPRLLIADEPTTALDVTIQVQILELMKELRDKMGSAIMLITHDLAVVAEMADRVVVMYAGKIMETADVMPIFKAPAHPYTRGLLDSIPRMDHDTERLPSIPGSMPGSISRPPGCRFHPRCPVKSSQCLIDEPELAEIRPGRWVRCWHPVL